VLGQRVRDFVPHYLDYNRLNLSRRYAINHLVRENLRSDPNRQSWKISGSRCIVKLPR